MAYKQLKFYFDKELAQLLAAKIEVKYSRFRSKEFVEVVERQTHGLELKARVEIIADNLRAHLPADYEKATRVLMQILGPPNENETGMFKEGYWLMPVAFFVEKYGLNDFDASIEIIKEITKRNTGEYAIRPFIRAYPKKTMAVMKTWSKDENVHVRRLASEGCRPRLPWATKLDMFIANPTPIMPILENLKDTKSQFVRKSVANNLNDILKDNYEIGMNLLEKWSKGAGDERKWIIKLALRNQVKKKDKQSLRIIRH